MPREPCICELAHAAEADMGSLTHRMVVNDWDSFMLEPLERFDEHYDTETDSSG